MPWTAVVPNWGRSMTTSSSEGNRCTRISPSAVLDDRLDGKDLEWARDHLRRCEACRDRVEDFREMLLRVGRLPSAAVGAAATDQAFAAAIPHRVRGEARSPPAPPPLPPPPPARGPGRGRGPPRYPPRTPGPAVRDYEPEAGPPGEPMPAPTGGNVVFEQDPALRFDEEIAPATLPRKPDTAMRLAVGLGAAACVLLAAVLYEGGWLAKGLHNLNSTSPTATATLHPSAGASPRLSALPSVSPPPPPAPVLFTLGNAVSGNSVFRISPGTAVAGYNRPGFRTPGRGFATPVHLPPPPPPVPTTVKKPPHTGHSVDSHQNYPHTR